MELYNFCDTEWLATRFGDNSDLSMGMAMIPNTRVSLTGVFMGHI